MLLTTVARATRRARARGERGQTLVEYALIIAVVSLGVVASLTFLREEITSVFSDSGSALSEAGTAPPPAPPPAAPASPTITSGPADGSIVAETSASFEFTGDGTQTSFECRLDDAAAFTTCASPQVYSGLGIGTHTFRVQASNAAGASTPAARTWTVGTRPSDVNVTILCDPAPCNAGDTATASLAGQPGVPAATVTYLWERNTVYFAECTWDDGWSSLGETDSIVLPPQADVRDPVRVTVTWTHPLGNVTDEHCLLFWGD